MDTKRHLQDTPALFTLEQQGIPQSEWEKLQTQLRDKLFLSNENCYFFPGNAPSLKNRKEFVHAWSKQSDCCKAGVKRVKIATGEFIGFCEKCGKKTRVKVPRLIPSKTVSKYRKEFGAYYLKNKPKFIMDIKKFSLPYLMGFYIVRDSKRKFDWINIMQIIQDEMKDYGYFEDDDSTIIIPYPLGFEVDPNRPGTYVKLLPNTFFQSIIDLL